MINLVFEDGKELKKKEGKYLISLLDGTIYEADSFRELTAVVCGLEYQDCECAETELHMRVKTAKRIGLATMAAEELNMTDYDQLEQDGEGEKEERFIENIIIYDERIGKIPYSYTDANVDYDIHGTPELIRVECDKTFIYSLEKDRLDREAFHEPSVLLRGHFPDFVYGTRPPELSGFKPFVQKQKSVAFPEKPFQSVFFTPAEKEKRFCLEGIKFKLVLYQCRKTINTIPEIHVSAGNVDVLNIGCIIEHSEAPPR